LQSEQNAGQKPPSAGEFDYVIVGGGSAGCVMAHRLSENPTVRVALFEAGQDTPPGAVPKEILDSYPLPIFCGERFIWPGLSASPVSGTPARLYEQARVLGGGSSINVQAANRGLPRDYDGWTEEGATGWSWEDVLPYFRSLESDLDYGTRELHGESGPIPIRRIGPHAWPLFCTSFAQAMRDCGLASLEDQNAEFGDGFFPSAFSNANDQRVSTAMGYLDAATRSRPNLSIRTDTLVDSLVMSAQAASGVTFRTSSGGRYLASAREVILCAGALQSPLFLLRAGIGDGQALRALDIPVIADRPGVGRNLQDHPALTFCHFLSPSFRTRSSVRRASMVAARFSSGLPGCDGSDMYLSSATRAAWHAFGRRFGLFFLWCNRPYSRGSVELVDRCPETLPRIELNLLEDERDTARLALGAHKLVEIIARAAFHRHAADLFPAAFSPRVKALSRYSPTNAFLSAGLAGLLDLPRPLRHWIVESILASKQPLEHLVADPDRTRAFVRDRVFGVWHASGTCKMGRPTDRLAVTDARGCVYGVEHLRVVDASLMPRLPSANTNIPTIMMAEKIAAEMIRARRTASLAGDASAAPSLTRNPVMPVP
jgi:5-(hydroxymethyl)furfural/furfural oxidase